MEKGNDDLMNKRCFLLSGVMLTLSACREADVVKEVEKSVERSIALMQNNKTRREGFVLGEKVKNDILSMTNPVARMECRNAFAGVLLSFDFTSSGLDYRTQGDLLGSIPKLVEGALFGPMWEGDELLNVYEVRFKLVDWHRQQLVRLKPTRKNDPHDGKTLSEEMKEWRRCYIGTFVSLRSLLFRLEDWWFPDEMGKLSVEQRESIRVGVEKCLGHPIRSRDEIRAAPKWETEEYREVKSFVVAP